jgi:hypothetical protein
LTGIRSALTGVGATLTGIRSTLAGIRSTLAGIGAALARTHDVGAASGEVEREEQYQESTAHDLHEGPSFVWGNDAA